jgi:hypothetical protein
MHAIYGTCPVCNEKLEKADFTQRGWYHYSTWVACPQCDPSTRGFVMTPQAAYVSTANIIEDEYNVEWLAHFAS